MEKSIMFSGIFWFVGFLMALFIIAWLLVEIGKRNTQRNKEYDLLYRKIQFFVFDFKINPKSYCIIFLLIDRLNKMKYKNPEKTEIIENYFRNKYQKLVTELLKEADSYLESNTLK